MHTGRKVLYTGASGKLAHTILPILAKTFSIIAVGNQKAPQKGDWQSVQADLTDDKLEALIEQSNPEIIINAAAMATDRQCYEDPQAAHRINTEVPEAIARIAAARDITVIHFSTDQVYEGKQRNYREDEKAIALNIYGQSKLNGEARMLQQQGHSIILRLALTFGLGSGDALPFSHALINQLQAGEQVNLFEDEYRSVLYIPDLATLLVALARTAGQIPAGIYNVGGRQSVNRVEFAQMICRQFGFSPSLINPVKAADLSFAEPRPADCSMNIDKLLAAVDWQPRNLDEAIAQMHRHYHSR